MYSAVIPAVCKVNATVVTSTNGTLSQLQQLMTELDQNTDGLQKLSECSNVGSILRKVLYGAPCNEFIQAQVFLTGSLMVTCVFILLILSTRAVVFSPIIAGRRCKRREKEFEDYKMYMSQFYDTKNWTLDFVPPEKEDLEFPRIQRTRTRSTVSPTSSTDSDTVVAQVFDEPLSKNKGDDDDNSSYDSTYSEDDGDDEDTSTAFSTLTRFFDRQYFRRRSGNESTISLSTNSLLDQVRVGGKRLVSMFVQDRYSHPIDEEQEENEDNDTAFGTMLTPQPLRYTARVRYSSGRKRRGDPEHFEMIALTPNAKSPSPN